MTNYRSFFPMQTVDEVVETYQTYGDIVINRKSYSVEEFLEEIEIVELLILKIKKEARPSLMELRARRELVHYLYSVQFALGI